MPFLIYFSKWCSFLIISFLAWIFDFPRHLRHQCGPFFCPFSLAVSPPPSKGGLLPLLRGPKAAWPAGKLIGAVHWGHLFLGELPPVVSVAPPPGKHSKLGGEPATEWAVGSTSGSSLHGTVEPMWPNHRLNFALGPLTITATLPCDFWIPHSFF